MRKNIRSLDKNYSFFTARPFARPLYVVLKPVGSKCNLACEYCYYLGKNDGGQTQGTGSGQTQGAGSGQTQGTGSGQTQGAGSGQTQGAAPTGGGMLSEELLEEFTRQYMEAQTMPQVLFTWHGGEPLLRPIAFYEKALQMQQHYAHGRQVDNCIQTNGTLLTDEWCQFLRNNRFLVGISIDGPQWIHDHYRRSIGGNLPGHSITGNASERTVAGNASERTVAGNASECSSAPSWHRVMRGIELLKKHGVEWNAMATVNDLTARHPQEFYQFFRELGCQFLQFTPVVERVPHHEGIAQYSVTPDAWGHFLCTVYDEWVKRDVGQLFVQTFDATLANWVGEPPGVCSLSQMCGHATVMETDGSVYSCDHFVFPEYRLGNIRQEPLTSLVYGDRQLAFGQQKSDALPRQCRECQWCFACHGECPRNRFVKDRYGNPGLNYLCLGYRQFFSHVAADMDFMAAELKAGRAPANIMIAKQPPSPQFRSTIQGKNRQKSGT